MRRGVSGTRLGDFIDESFKWRDQDVAMTLGLGTLISRRVLVPRHVSPRRVNENILHSCSKRAFTWRNEVTSVSVFNIVVACL